VRQKKKRQPQDSGTAEKHAKHAADATAEAATIAQEAAEQRRRTVAEAEAERERRAKEAREAAQLPPQGRERPPPRRARFAPEAVAEDERSIASLNREGRRTRSLGTRYGG
jgi:hypothetical protein